MTTPADDLERSRRLRFLGGGLFCACLFGYVRVGWLPAGRGSLPVLAAAALLSLGGWLAQRSGPPALASLLRRAAPLWGLATWGLLVHLGGGAGRSLFVAGFWVEILLAALVLPARGIAWTTLASLAVLAGQQVPLGFAGAAGPLALHGSFVLLVGAVVGGVRRSWDRRQRRFASHLDAQERRLAAIEERLADAHALAELGAQAARLGHGLKNAVHSLRGFTTLIERRGRDAGKEDAALRGLREAIDQLEELARDALRPGSDEPPDEAADDDLRAVVEAVVRETRQVYPGVRCRVDWPENGAPRVPGGVMTEVLSNLLRNSAESMEQAGEVTVRVSRSDGRYEIRVADRGPGVPPEMAERLFRPGHSTKATGHGMGLYVARRLMEARGGALALEPSEAGASFRVTLPEAWGARTR